MEASGHVLRSEKRWTYPLESSSRRLAALTAGRLDAFELHVCSPSMSAGVMQSVDTETDKNPNWMSVSAVAALLGKSPRHIRQRAADQLIKARRTPAGDWLVLVIDGRPVNAAPRTTHESNAGSATPIDHGSTADVGRQPADDMNATFEILALRSEIAELRAKNERLQERLTIATAEIRKWHGAVVTLTAALAPTAEQVRPATPDLDYRHTGAD